MVIILQCPINITICHAIQLVINPKVFRMAVKTDQSFYCAYPKYIPVPFIPVNTADISTMKIFFMCNNSVGTNGNTLQPITSATYPNLVTSILCYIAYFRGIFNNIACTETAALFFEIDEPVS